MDRSTTAVESHEVFAYKSPIKGICFLESWWYVFWVILRTSKLATRYEYFSDS